MNRYICNICDKEFNSHFKLGGHKGGHNRKLKSIYPLEKPDCLVCGFKVKEFYNKLCSKKCVGVYKQMNTKRKIKDIRLDVNNFEISEYRMRQLVCEICGKMENKRLSVDHNHNNNKFRGLLCSLCNRQLGWFENNRESILTYLKDS